MKKILQHILLGFSALTISINSNAATGGPDSFGYSYIDSNEPGGPRFNWIEIATPLGGTGTLSTTLQCDDCHEFGIPLGFNFPFYGTNYDTIAISSNGTVYFEDTYLGLSNSCIPGTPTYTMSQYNFIAHMWDDLDPGSQGGIYTKAFPNFFVIEYYDIVPCCGTGDGDSWQIILFSNGNILFQYKELSNQGIQTDFTIGIQNDPATGLQYVCDGTGNTIASNMAILFTHPNFTCSSVSPNVLGSDTTNCTGTPIDLLVDNSVIAQTWNDNSTNPSLTASATGTFSVIALDTNGCTLLDTINVTINTAPSVTFNLSTTSTCVNYAPIVLAGGTPAGGSYSGTGVSAGEFDPSVGAGTYTVTYTYTDPSTNCAASADQTITVDACLGVTESASEHVAVYPNPASNFMTIENRKGETYSVELINLMGQVTHQQSISSEISKIDVSGLTNGVYFVKISNSSVQQSFKVVIQH